MPTIAEKKGNFLAACDTLGWVISDTSATTADIAEALFDRAHRGSDAWARIMVRVRDAVTISDAGGSREEIGICLQEAHLRAIDASVPLPGA